MFEHYFVLPATLCDSVLCFVSLESRNHGLDSQGVHKNEKLNKSSLGTTLSAKGDGEFN